MSDSNFNNIPFSGMVLGVVSGILFPAFYPAYASLGYLLSFFGICSGALEIGTWSKFDKLWKSLNFVKGNSKPILKSKKKTGYSTVFTFTLPAGLSLEDFQKKENAISQYLGYKIDIKYTFKAIQIEVFDSKYKTIYEYKKIDCKGNLEFPVGYDKSGNIITCDLSYGEPHMLIAGETGSGKSTALRSIITNIILTKDVKLHLIDLKRGAEFQIFSKCKSVVDFAKTRKEALIVLNKINSEVDRRYDLFFKHDVVDIKEYNSKVGKMEYELLIIDEFADLHSDKDSIAILEEIAAKARACGIHLIISTQRPDAKILNGRIKANVTTVLGLKTVNEVNSRIVIDKPMLENLKGNGEGFFKKGKEVLVQCPYLSTQRAREFLNDFYVDKQITDLISNREGDLLC